MQSRPSHRHPEAPPLASDWPLISALNAGGAPGGAGGGRLSFPPLPSAAINGPAGMDLTPSMVYETSTRNDWFLQERAEEEGEEAAAVSSSSSSSSSRVHSHSCLLFLLAGFYHLSFLEVEQVSRLLAADLAGASTALAFEKWVALVRRRSGTYRSSGFPHRHPKLDPRIPFGILRFAASSFSAPASPSVSLDHHDLHQYASSSRTLIPLHLGLSILLSRQPTSMARN